MVTRGRNQAPRSVTVDRCPRMRERVFVLRAKVSPIFAGPQLKSQSLQGATRDKDSDGVITLRTLSDCDSRLLSPFSKFRCRYITVRKQADVWRSPCETLAAPCSQLSRLQRLRRGCASNRAPRRGCTRQTHHIGRRVPAARTRSGPHRGLGAAPREPGSGSRGPAPPGGSG